MKTMSNTILITGAGSGLGMGLAQAFHKLGNQVIITGRREDRLRLLCAANPGMKYYRHNVADPTSIQSLCDQVAREVPSLNCVINNAGVQSTRYNFSSGQPFDDAGMLAEIQINVIGLIRMCVAFTPLLKGKEGATFVNVSSGLAFVPLSNLAVYCATKAAVHSYSLSLRRQLRDFGIRVTELVPPYVVTELGGPTKTVLTTGPQPMPLETFVEEAMKGLATDADEVNVGQATNLAVAGGLDSQKALFARMNP